MVSLFPYAKDTSVLLCPVQSMKAVVCSNASSSSAPRFRNDTKREKLMMRKEIKINCSQRLDHNREGANAMDLMTLMSTFENVTIYQLKM